MRALAPAWQRAQEINTDLVGLIDAYAVTFVNELDYSREAAATTAFSQAMRERGLGSVTAPEVVPALSSTHVLTTKVRISNPNPNPNPDPNPDPNPNPNPNLSETSWGTPLQPG